MTKDDEIGKLIHATLQSSPPMDKKTAIEEKRKFLIQGENLRQGYIPISGNMDKQLDEDTAWMLSNRRPHPALKALVAVLVALIVLVGSSLTVYAANDSLPGEPLYKLKSWSEDVRLSLTYSPQARLDITLDYTNRRVDEISRLLAAGKSLPAHASERYQGELEDALEFAAEMEDMQMQEALWEIKNHAENQGMTIEELLNKLPNHAESAISHLQERLCEQVSLSTIGESDPKAFRWEIRERQQSREHNNKSKSINHDTTSTPLNGSSTPPSSESGGSHGDGYGQPTKVPDQDDGHPGQGNQNPGNGDHGAEPSRTPKP